MKLKISILTLILCLSACSISYKFNGAMIDYSKTKTISVADFPSVAESNPYTALPYEFSEALRDIYTRQTRLQVIKSGGDMNLEGEITSLQLAPMAISEDSYAAQTKVTITIRVRYSNKAVPEDDFEKTYSAFRQFSSSTTLNDALSTLVPEIIKEITEMIFNDTAGKW
ncbi:MAG: LPS assembly lipoprotein LptE [Paludibacter sp.]|nr:LPS assembly lipoprotein LptE [Paludibacter sp.]